MSPSAGVPICEEAEAPNRPTHLATLKAALDSLASAVAERATCLIKAEGANTQLAEASRRAAKAKTEFDAALATFTKAVGDLSK